MNDKQTGTQPKTNWLTVLIVLAALAVVLGPVFVPREIARWYLAAAQNAFRKNDSVLAEHYLQQAIAWDEDIQNDGDYWIAQVPNAKVQNADQLLDLIERAVMSDSRWRRKAAEVSEILAEVQDFQRAVRALKIYFLNQRPTSTSGLNQLAYLRALAALQLAQATPPEDFTNPVMVTTDRTELEAALKDIDLAISRTINGEDLNEVLRRDTFNNPGELGSYLDTKAWVLHALGRDLEALGYMHRAIELVELQMAQLGQPLPEPLSSEQVEALPDEDHMLSAIANAKERMGDGFNLAVMRFHRLRILESLDRRAEAQADEQWLTERGVPVADELF